jgi:hypothetical protein
MAARCRSPRVSSSIWIESITVNAPLQTCVAHIDLADADGAALAR